MTREEIISNLLDMKHSVKEDTIEDMTINEAIEALEQEPCEDAISREAVLKCFTLDNTKADVWNNIKALPPVTSKLIECEDCVSRQAVLDLAKFDGRKNLGSIIHAFDVEQLPPVKPQPCEDVPDINVGDKAESEG